MKVGSGYLFAFSKDETFEEGQNHCFVVVEKQFFNDNGHLESVHFTDTHEMPAEFYEDMESNFLVNASLMSEAELKERLIGMGFEYSPELQELFNE